MRVRQAFARFGGLQSDQSIADVIGSVSHDVSEDEDEERTRTGLRLQRRPRVRAIDKVSLHAYAGSCIALVGPEGAGKTVLLKLMGAVVLPTRGRVVIRGSVAPALSVLSRLLPVKGHTVKSALPFVAAAVGIPPQFVHERFEEIAHLLEFPRLKETAMTVLESREKRELILATMLSLEPTILLVDIPISRDAFGERCVERIDELRARGSLVVAEMRDAQRTLLVPDRVVRIDEGRIVSDGPYDPGAQPEPAGTKS